MPSVVLLETIDNTPIRVRVYRYECAGEAQGVMTELCRNQKPSLFDEEIEGFVENGYFKNGKYRVYLLWEKEE